jgi:hypothetical protein
VADGREAACALACCLSVWQQARALLQRRLCRSRRPPVHRSEHAPAVGKLDSDCTGRNWQHVLHGHHLGACIVRAAVLRIGDPHRGQVSRLRLAKAELSAPSEQHAGDDPVRTGNLRHCCAGLLGLEHDRPLLGLGESAPVSAVGRRRISCRRCCQDVFGRRSLSTIASISAYGQPDTRMQARSPVDLQRIGIESSAPGAQAVDRDVVCLGVRLGGQSAPVQRLDMHRPERLDGLVMSVLGYWLVRALAPLTCLDPGRFKRI